jgi:hypothetical protein
MLSDEFPEYGIRSARTIGAGRTIHLRLTRMRWSGARWRQVPRWTYRCKTSSDGFRFLHRPTSVTDGTWDTHSIEDVPTKGDAAALHRHAQAGLIRFRPTTFPTASTPIESAHPSKGLVDPGIGLRNSTSGPA